MSAQQILRYHEGSRDSKHFFKGDPVARNVKDAFELKAGRWAVDSFFILPPESPLGVYALEVGLETSGGQTQKQIRSFVVSSEFYLGGQ